LFWLAVAGVVFSKPQLVEQQFWTAALPIHLSLFWFLRRAQYQAELHGRGLLQGRRQGLQLIVVGLQLCQAADRMVTDVLL
jgi:hypothetical protein